MLIRLNESEFNLILGALRLWQRTDAQSIPDSILEISEPDDGPDGLNDEQIDALCERLNTEEAKVNIGIYIEGGLVQDVVCDARGFDYVKVDADIMEGAGAEEMRELWSAVKAYNEIASDGEKLDLDCFQRGYCLKCGDEEHDGGCDPMVDAPKCEGYGNGVLLAYRSCGNRAVAHVRRSDHKMMRSAIAGCSSSHANLCTECLGKLALDAEVTVELRYEPREVAA